MTFEEELRVENRLKQEREHNAILKRKIYGEDIYNLFWVWCKAFNEKTDEKTFKRFLEQENKTLNFWQEKHLNEKYFGYKYTYNYEEEKWSIELWKTKYLY